MPFLFKNKHPKVVEITRCLFLGTSLARADRGGSEEKELKKGKGEKGRREVDILFSPPFLQHLSIHPCAAIPSSAARAPLRTLGKSV